MYVMLGVSNIEKVKTNNNNIKIIKYCMQQLNCIHFF